MRKLLKILVSLVVLLIVAAVAVPFLIPMDKYKSEIVAQVKAATGRDLVIGGDIRLSIFPTLNVQVGQVSLSSPDGFAAKQMLQADDITLEVGLAALLDKKLDIKTFALKHPVINLEVSADGKQNWVFAAAAKPEEAAPAAQPADSKSSNDMLAALVLGAVNIDNGEVHYNDIKNKKFYDLTALNVKAGLVGLQQPFKASGDAVYNGEKIALDVSAASPQDVLDKKPTDFSLSLKSAPVTLKYEGKLLADSVSGALALTIPSVPKLAAFAGTVMDWKGKTPLAFSVNGNLDASADSIALSKSEIALDDVKLKGDVKVVLSDKVPNVTATLAADKLDFNPYMKQAANDNSLFIADAYAMEPWSAAKIDLSGLNAVNATINLTTNALLVQKIKLGKTVLNAVLNNGALKLTVPEAALYGGKATGNVALNAAGALNKQFTVAGVKLGDFLKDATGSDRFSGTMNASGNISGRLTSIRDLVGSLSGNAKVELTDGALHGVDIAGLIHKVQAIAKTASTSSASSGETDFSEMSGSFTIANGIVTNKDLSMKAPLLRLSGQGTVDLPAQRVHYRLLPSIVTTAQGQGGKAAPGLEIPVNVEGTLDAPTFTPDVVGAVNSALQNPDAIKNTVKSVKDQLKSGNGNVNDLKGLLKGIGR